MEEPTQINTNIINTKKQIDKDDKTKISSFFVPEEQSIIGTILAYSLTSGILALSIFGLNQIFDVRNNMNVTLIICRVSSFIIYIISWMVSHKK